MAQKDTHGESTAKFPVFTLTPEEMTQAGKQRLEDFTNTQNELLQNYQEASRRWLDRMQVEAQVATDFMSKLSAAGSIPNAISICQEWTNQYVKMLSEDRDHLVADWQKFAATAARFLPNGRPAKTPGSSK